MTAALELGALDGKPVLFRLPGLAPLVQDVYRAAADVCEVRELPWAFETPATPFPPAAAFARSLDIRDFAFDPAFRGVAMIDYFLRALGLDPLAVPPALRRNAWLALRMPRFARQGYALLCPRTSMTLRTMPEAVHTAIAETLLALGLPVVTQGTALPGVQAAPQATSLTELCALVAGAKLMISADTAMPHLADAFGVPCLTFFTTHRPEWRARDYPCAQAISLPVEGLPDALEFSRGAEDEAAAARAWVRRGEDLAWVRDAAGAFAAAV